MIITTSKSIQTALVLNTATQCDKYIHNVAAWKRKLQYPCFYDWQYEHILKYYITCYTYSTNWRLTLLYAECNWVYLQCCFLTKRMMYLKLSKTHHTGHLYRIVGQKLHSCLYSSTQGIVSTRGVDILPWMHDFRYLKIICIFLKIICRFFAFQSKKFMVAWFLWWLDAHTSSIYTVLTVCTWNNQIHHLHENTVQTLAVMLHGNNRTDSFTLYQHGNIIDYLCKIVT